VMFADCVDDAFMDEAIAAGVSSYNVRGVAFPDVRPIVQAAVAIFRRYQKVAADLEAAELRLDDQAAIQKAKVLLMRERRMSEPQAHRWLQRRAMEKGRRLAEVARQVLATGKAEGQ
jgi:two-component system, response regulator / RNA-binding antiterminator